MKTAGILAGIGVVLAAVYFIARGKSLPTLNSKQGSGSLPKPNPNQALASQLLTSQNIGAITTLFGGSATPAKAAPLVSPTSAQSPAPAIPGPIVTTIDTPSSESDFTVEI